MPLAADPDRAGDAARSAAAAFEVQLDVFSGPLELLLQLIESRQLDVLTVPLADLADAYVAHLANHAGAHRAARRVRVDRLAADPAQVTAPAARRAGAACASAAEDEPDEEELRRRLIEYRIVRDAARASSGARDLAAAELPSRAARGGPAGGSLAARCRPCCWPRRWIAWRPSRSPSRRRPRSSRAR